MTGMLFARLVSPMVRKMVVIKVSDDASGVSLTSKHLGQEVSLTFDPDDVNELIFRLKKARKSAICAQKSEESATKTFAPPPL